MQHFIDKFIDDNVVQSDSSDLGMVNSDFKVRFELIMSEMTVIYPYSIKKMVTFGGDSNLEKKKPIPSLADMRKRFLRKNSSQIFSVKVENRILEISKLTR